jgi:hypothetical protein
MKQFSNSKKNRFLGARPQNGIETSGISERCKFNFSYFDPTQAAGQDFGDWNADSGLCSLATLLEKIKSYTKEPLSYWRNQRVGGGGLSVFEDYRHFPNLSDFVHPPHVPHDVIWSRFRLGNKVRLVGFILPQSMAYQQINENSKFHYDTNTFYVVFLDKEHHFYKTEQS